MELWHMLEKQAGVANKLKLKIFGLCQVLNVLLLCSNHDISLCKEGWLIKNTVKRGKNFKC